jgi:hypothetical protein
MGRWERETLLCDGISWRAGDPPGFAVWSPRELSVEPLALLVVRINPASHLAAQAAGAHVLD